MSASGFVRHLIEWTTSQMQMEPFTGFSASADLKEKLMTSLMTFLQLYDQQNEGVRRASERLTQEAARVAGELEKWFTYGLVSVLGGAVGALCGGVTGGIWGAMGAVGATTYGRLCGDVKALRATIGCFGSIFGGVVGGAFSGSVGAAVDVGAEVAGCPGHAVVRRMFWFAVGFTTGGAIGSTFGGSVGAAGGAVGGGFGALHASTAVVYLFKSMFGCSKTSYSKKHRSQVEEAKVMQKTGDDFSRHVKPLLEELKTIQEITDKMASGDAVKSVAVKSVAEQAAKTLAAVSMMQESMSDCQKAADLPQFISCVEETAKQCRKIPEELKEARVRVEKLLVSLRRH